MNSIILSFLITILAGFSTMLGVFPIYFHKKKQDVIIPVCLSFAAGVMISISLFSLIPEAIDAISQSFVLFPAILIVSIFIVVGILFSSFVDQKIEKRFSNNQLYKLGLISVIALMFHNIPEGITTFISSNQDLRLGITLSIGIALHNIPEGISIAVPIYFATKNKKKAILLTFISGFSEFFGAVFAYLFLAPLITSFGLGVILALAAGIMIHISIYELIPTAYRFSCFFKNTIAFIIGFFVMLVCQMLI